MLLWLNSGLESRLQIYWVSGPTFSVNDEYDQLIHQTWTTTHCDIKAYPMVFQWSKYMANHAQKKGRLRVGLYINQWHGKLCHFWNNWCISPLNHWTNLPGNQPRLRDLEWLAWGVWMGEIVSKKKTVGFSRFFWLFTQEVYNPPSIFWRDV